MISSLLAVVVIGMEETTVTVQEDIGQRELCASIMNNVELRRDVVVTIAYEDISAVGKSFLSARGVYTA